MLADRAPREGASLVVAAVTHALAGGDPYDVLLEAVTPSGHLAGRTVAEVTAIEVAAGAAALLVRWLTDARRTLRVDPALTVQRLGAWVATLELEEVPGG